MKKLRTSKGSSIIIALIFFLLCSVVGTIILTGATANAGRLDKERLELQSYLAVSSAARMLSEAFGSAKVEYEESDAPENPGEPILPEPGTLSYLTVGIHTKAVSLPRALSIEGEGGLPDVSAALTEEGAAIKVELEAEDGQNAMWFRIRRSGDVWEVGSITKGLEPS